MYVITQTRRFSLVLLFLLSFTGLSCFAQAKKTTPAPAPAKAPAAAPKVAAPAAGAAHPGTAAGATHTGPTTAGAGHTTTTTTSARTTTTGAGGRTTTTTTSRTTTTEGGRGAGMTAGRGAEGGARGGAVAAHGNMSPGHPTPAGVHETRAANGAVVRTRPNGRVSDLHDERRGMDVHHNLDGNRRVFVERGDHSRVFAERGGRGYVQHPYHYGRYEYGHRTYYDHGRYYDRYYNRYEYRPGLFLDVYAPVRYYPVGFYGWAYNPWAAPIVYPWGWGGAPWYGYYGAAYFTPYGAYPSASYWLTDYMISASLQAAYAAQAEAAAAGPPPPAGPPALTPEVKAQIAAEVQLQISLENNEAQQNSTQKEVDPAGSNVGALLGDNKQHVFLVGSDLDLVGTDGQECPISQGDVIQVTAPIQGESATAIVLSSKPWRKECRISGPVQVAMTDLQDMQNHMRETIDAGMGDLQSKQGQGGLPPAPPSARAAPVTAAFAANAPPPDQTASVEIAQQTAAADAAEKEAGPSPGVSDGTQAPAPIVQAPPAAAPVSIAIGQTVDQVTASLGQPKTQFAKGASTVYVYNNMKITFKAGKVTDIE